MNSRNTDIALLLLRLGFGAAMAYGHGWGKLNRLFSGEEISFFDPFGIGPVASLGLVVFAEFLCSILVALGLMTRLAVIPLIITMLVAVFMRHAGDPFGNIEKGLMYLFAFVALSFSGAGAYSLDALIKRKR
jgi:putative oxidoreductase